MENPQRNALLGDIIDIDAGKMYGLFKDWYERTAELGNEPTDKPYNHYCLVCDGITRKREKDSTRAVDEAITEMAWEKDKKRVAFLIKDENQKGSIWADDTRNWLVQTPADDTAEKIKRKQNNWNLKRKFLRNIANILWGITNCAPDLDKLCPTHQIHSHFDKIKETFQTTPFAIIECKKQGGKPSIADNVLERYLTNYQKLLYREFDILEPHIYVCTNEKIYSFVKKYIVQKYGGAEDILTHIPNRKGDGTNEPSILLHIPSKTIILCSFHPSARMSYDKIYDGVMDHYRAFVQSSYYAEFFKKS